MTEAKINSEFWKNKKVLLTGHTGFKGSWLALWLHKMGAQVTGLALAPDTNPNLYSILGIDKKTKSHIGDIRDLETVKNVFNQSQPEIVFHLAAQPLVRYSYKNPLETYQTNVMGTAHILEAVRSTPSVRSVLIITTDKVYENKEWVYGYRENEPLGGYDPYSSSKACAEILTASYRNSFFPKEKWSEHKVAIATARAGNVFGGGDWSADRLLPDIINAFQTNQKVKIRNPISTRPWQHVLEPLSGYLTLAQNLHEKNIQFAESFNFGPTDYDCVPVKELVSVAAKIWGEGAGFEIDSGNHPHEAGLLKLDSSKAYFRMGWKPTWNLKISIEHTLNWYKHYHNKTQELEKFSLLQIEKFHADFSLKQGS